MAEAAFGVQLRRSRQAAALSLRQLATRVGYDHSYLSQVERGQRPGSAHLARLCDRELGTGDTLATAYTLARPLPQPAGPPSPALLKTPTAGVDVLETVRRGLADSVGKVLQADEWSAVTRDHARDFPVTPLAELLPELTGDVQLLRAEAAERSGADGWTTSELAVPAAELSVLIALTLTGIGRLQAAGRWWRTARAAADSSAEPRVTSLARGWEAISGLSERRPLPDLLELAEDALTLADRPTCTARALAARAQILAQLDRPEDARRALQDLLAVTDDRPVRSGGATSLFDWSEYETSWVEGLVQAALGETDPAYLALDRALALCPAGSLRERAELELVLARCLVLDGEVAAGLAVAMRVLVELPDQWHTHYLYEAAGRVLSAVQGKDLGRAAVRDYRELLVRRPYHNRSVGSGSSSAWPQG